MNKIWKCFIKWVSKRFNARTGPEATLSGGLVLAGITSWEQVRDIVRVGMLDNELHIGNSNRVIVDRKMLWEVQNG